MNFIICIVFCRLTERFNQTLVTHLVKHINSNSDNWDEFLDPIAFAYRCGRQASARTSPFELMYGVKPRLPSELQTTLDSTVIQGSAEEGGQEQTSRLQQIAERVSDIRDTALSNIQQVQAK